MKTPSILLFNLMIIVIFSNSQAQLIVQTGQTPQWYVENILTGVGVTVSNVSYTGSANAIGHFQTGITPTNLGINEGIILSTGEVNNNTIPIGSPASNFSSINNSTLGDALLNTLIPGYNTFDAAILEFDFFPLSDTLKFRYVFSSEEYPEWVGSTYNDVFGFFVTGPNPMGGNYSNQNIALIPSTSLPVTINNVNANSHSQFFIDNLGSFGQSIVFDGFTTVLEAWVLVTPCVNYNIKIAIADAGDNFYDSAVFLEANSFGTNSFNVEIEYSIPGTNNYAIEGCADALLHFKLPETLTSDYILHYNIAGSAINGIDYNLIPDSIIIPAGQISTTIPISPIYDGIIEGTEDVLLIFTNVCGNLDTISLNIWDYQIPTATATGQTSFCESNIIPVELEVIIDGGFSPFNYNWSDGLNPTSNPTLIPEATNTYYVTATDLCGFDAISNVTVTIFDDPNVSILANKQYACIGENLILTGDGAISYFWQDFSTTTNPIEVYPDSSSKYILIGTDINGCIGYDTIVIPVYPIPNVSFSGVPSESCVPVNVSFFTVTPDSNITDWHWDFGNGENANSSNPTHLYEDYGDFTVSLTLTNDYGCSSTLSIDNFISAWPQPKADFSIIPEYGKTYESTISFFSTSNANNWSWIFGDGNTSNTPNNASNTYPDAEDSYEVTLIISNEFGCADTISKIVYIINDVIILPNIITPNGDGINDYFIIENADKYPNNLLQVFNRWGEIVYEQQNYKNTWDGDGLSDGTYFIVFQYIDKSIKGSLTILR